MTAHRGVYADGPVDGLTVLVSGGAGSVGNYAVQFAKHGGATVVATAGTEEKANIARAAGADHVVNYREEDVAARVGEITGGQGVDRIVEVAFGQNLPLVLDLLKTNGTVAAYGSDADHEPRLPFYAMLQKAATVRFVFVYVLPEPALEHATSDITALLGSGGLRHNVGPRFALDDVAAAHEAVDDPRRTGNVVVEIG